MKKYEAMFVVKPDLSEEDRKNLFNQISEVIAKNGGNVTKADIWSDRRKLCFPIKKYNEGVYYLVNFTAKPDTITTIRHAYNLNENILRVLISVST